MQQQRQQVQRPRRPPGRCVIITITYIIMALVITAAWILGTLHLISIIWASVITVVAVIVLPVVLIIFSPGFGAAPTPDAPATMAPSPSAIEESILIPLIPEETRHAPRVLNANFADPVLHRIIEPNEGLVAKREYDLLVDIGPRWNTIKSLVTGQANFPEYALPPTQSGYILQVVLMSEDFSPNMISAQMWVPRQAGRSTPIENGQRAEQPGPVTLRLHTPAVPSSNSIETVVSHARLSLYYENNLLQSAVVKVGIVSTEGVQLEEVNTVEVDYVLSSTFQQIEERFARRAVKFTSTDDAFGHPVRLNLTLNDDGGSGHRIIISHLMESDEPFVPPQQIKCPPRGWTPYDPQAVLDNLEKARDQLLRCFYLKDDYGNLLRDLDGQPRLALNGQNGKPREQFKRDLFDLSLLGSELYDSVFNQVITEDVECKASRWKRNLEMALAEPCVIQIARTSTTPAQYVFPWALLYTYPLVSAERDKWVTCDIIDEEWSEEGIRRKPQSKEEAKRRHVCPYHSEKWHRGNIVCPYGFWGLKHIIEQPPSVLIKRNGEWMLRDADNYILASTTLGLSIGVTRDTKLDASGIDQHLAKLANLGAVRFNPLVPAEDWEDVCTMLTAPEIVYFLCHNEYDEVQKKPYLSIGVHDDQPVHKIYPDTLDAWSRMPDGPNLDEWDRRHPLIFINGCHTVDLKPGRVLDFVTTFTAMGASGVVGTEVSILLPVATEVAESLFDKLVQQTLDDRLQSLKLSVGQALYEIRWDLASKGNLLGLAYTLYGLADLHIVTDNQ